MPTYKNAQYGFALELPGDFHCQNDSLFSKLSGKKTSELVFSSSMEYFTMNVSPCTAGADLNALNKKFIAYAAGAMHKDVVLSSIAVAGSRHVCACYLMGVTTALRSSVAMGMTKSVMRSYGGSENMSEFLEDSYRHDSGPVVKEYWLTFGTQRYTVLCRLGFGTVAEVDSDFKSREEEYDRIVASFRR